MLGRSAEYDPRISKITRQLAAIESELEDIGGRASRKASAGVSDVRNQLAATVRPYLDGIADRLSGTQDYAIDRAAALQNRATQAGGQAIGRLAEQAKEQPLLALAVAFGIGILIGSLTRGASLIPK
jgi:ElaB/YqjD/DUF883 family membrane-anchored ribosome-binding protein